MAEEKPHFDKANFIVTGTIKSVQPITKKELKRAVTWRLRKKWKNATEITVRFCEIDPHD